MYECFIKFGFGRATADCNLAIKAGRMTREEAVKIVKEKDGIFPEKYISDYLDYFEMHEDEFWAVTDRFANKDVLEKKNGRWKLKDSVLQVI